MVSLFTGSSTSLIYPKHPASIVFQVHNDFLPQYNTEKRHINLNAKCSRGLCATHSSCRSVGGCAVLVHQVVTWDHHRHHCHHCTHFFTLNGLPTEPLLVPPVPPMPPLELELPHTTGYTESLASNTGVRTDVQDFPTMQVIRSSSMNPLPNLCLGFQMRLIYEPLSYL